MRHFRPVLFIPCLFGFLGSCLSPAPGTEEDRQIAEGLFIEWELISNRVADEPRCRSLLLIRNESKQTLNDRDWAIYFNQDVNGVIPGTVTGNVTFTHLGGDFFRLSPDEGFRLRPGEEVIILSDHGGWLIKEEQAPAGLYMVFMDEAGMERSRHPVKNYVIRPFTRPEQTGRFTIDQTPDPTPQWQYEQNEGLTELDPGALPLIIPDPASVSLSGGTVALGVDSRIRHSNGLTPQASFLADRLKGFLGEAPDISEDDARGEGIIHLGLTGDLSRPESYRLDISESHGISIQGADAAGVFYGIQSLLALVPPVRSPGRSGDIKIPACTIEDAPRFPYRGMHLDVARNFNKKEAVFRLVDVMSFYKLNKLHLHLTDDEGWRLQILRLPELTGIGAFRGHTLEEHEYLHPSYGSGPEPDPDSGFGSGFYTREDFIQILNYAHTRHIEVIPEFDLPGHARAAIIAMNARYRRLLSEGKEEEAREYLLSDPDDRSVYFSAQRFDDNVVCVCQEATYRFVETVVDEVIDMYREAGVPLHTIHIGGDEVPRGAWAGSPVCLEFLRETDIKDVQSGLMNYFLARTGEILKERDLVLSGWEEITLERDETGYTVREPMTVPGYQVYIWDNFTAGNQDIGYRIANAGYSVVLCSATNFYFELAYNKHPREPGHYWGGFTDTYKAFEYIPFHVFRSIHTDPLGRPYDPEVDFREMEMLDPGAEKNILGLQGELWSEPIKGPEMLEYFYLPKMLGLAERAWSSQPGWATMEDATLRRAALNDAWNRFANALGQRELPRLDEMSGGYHYRLPAPGMKIMDGILHANAQFPGLTIRYTTDGSEPTPRSVEYTGPISVSSTVRARTFSTTGRGSMTSTITGS